MATITRLLCLNPSSSPRSSSSHYRSSRHVCFPKLWSQTTFKSRVAVTSGLSVKCNHRPRSSLVDAEDGDSGASVLSTALIETNSGSFSLTQANDGAFGSSTVLMETNSSTFSLAETNDSASSSSIALTRNCYDVFLSFRGSDTREGFTDHLYNGLVDAGIRAFRDSNELRQGEEIRPDLLSSIKNSKILIPILSVNYGSSKWCLDELVQIMECKKNNMGHIVLPIFYKVEPTHVRHQSGGFGDAFRKRSLLEFGRHILYTFCAFWRHNLHVAGATSKREVWRGFNSTFLDKWKEALKEVSSLKGWEAKGSEGALVKSVVQKVLRELKKEFELVIPENLVGIDSHVKKVMEFIDNNSSATLFVGIHGMGGIGKTTLAKTIYNKLSDQFENCSFIADIRDSSKCNGLEYLQNQLISDILNKKNQICNKDEGTQFISSKFGGKKVLILLDDVDDDDQLKALAGSHDWFSSGSTILITTRNKSILDNAKVDYHYEPEELDMNQSLILFSRHAFRMNSPPREFEDLSYKVVSTTGGLPLCLEVLGSFLCGKKPMVWRGTIDKLRKVSPRKVREKLRISYEALDYEQQQIFLDIACFFIYIRKIVASYMWETCDFFPEEAIEVLTFMSLIKVGENNELRMHDQLRDLGMEIVREENQQEPQYRSRLWDYKEVLKVLNGNKGNEKIKAICLNKGRSEGSDRTDGQSGDIHTEVQFKNFTSLRFLDVTGAQLSGDFKNSVEELRWLRWRNCPPTFKANNFHVKQLVLLIMSGNKISDAWPGWSSIMMAEKLKYLDLTSCQSLKSTFFLSAFKNLEYLILRDCKQVEQINSSIGDMKSLACLNLSGCTSLKELPAEVGELEALRDVFLRDCSNFSVLPDNIGDLQNLEMLDISGTGIIELPNGIGTLRKLQGLNASRCKKLGGKMLESICNLSSLQRLDFSGCEELQSLPELPSSIIDLSVTCQSRRLPSLSHLTDLQVLRIIDCKFLECISELPSTLLELSQCTQLTKVEQSESPKSPNPSKLDILEIDGSELMETLDISQFKHLRTLVVKDCKRILEVRGLHNLNYLEILTIQQCASLERLDLSQCKDLKYIHVENCENLVEIEGLDSLEFLKIRHISGCNKLPMFKLLTD